MSRHTFFSAYFNKGSTSPLDHPPPDVVEEKSYLGHGGCGLFRNSSLEQVQSVLSGSQFGYRIQQRQLHPLANASQICQQSISVVSG